MKGVISISLPYMQISSAIKKYHNKINKKKLALNDKIPTKLMEKAIASRVRMAKKAQRNNIQTNPTLPVFTYEQFCSNPNSLVQAFSAGNEDAQGRQAITKVEGKNIPASMLSWT